MGGSQTPKSEGVLSDGISCGDEHQKVKRPIGIPTYTVKKRRARAKVTAIISMFEIKGCTGGLLSFGGVWNGPRIRFFSQTSVS